MVEILVASCGERDEKRAGLEWVDRRGGCLLSSFVRDEKRVLSWRAWNGLTGAAVVCFLLLFALGSLRLEYCETEMVECTYDEAKKKENCDTNSKTPRAIDDL